jgi:undecaprenyl-diphosphatase
MRSSFHRFDTAVTHWVATTFGQSFRPFFEFMTMLGDPVAIGLVSAAIIGIGLKTSNIRLAISGAAIPATLLVGAVLKLIFERARPVTEYAMSMRIHTFSFPSGHSSGSTITYGLLAYFAIMKLPTPWNVIAGAVLAALPIFVGLSRVYLGAHFPTDVVAGWILGLIVLVIVIVIVHPLS